MILIYLNEHSEDQDTIRQILDEQGHSFKEVGDNHLELTLAQIFSDETPVKESKQYENFLFLDTLQKDEITALSKAFQEKGIQLGRVAVRTENNISWKLQALMDEVEEEFQYFLVRDELYFLLTHPDKERLEKDAGYRRLLSGIYALVEDEQTPADVLKEAIAMIRQVSGQQ